MGSDVDSFLRDLEERDRRERALGLPPEQRGRSIPREVGQFLHLLARAVKARDFLEIGTSIGYSTIWLGLAAQANAGHVLSLELEDARAAQARRNLAQAGLDEVVTVHTGRAEAYLAGLSPDDRRFDFAFLDAEKEDYAGQFELVFPLVRAGGFIIADNSTSHADLVAPYLEQVEAHPNLETVVVPIGRGEAVSLKVDERLPAHILALFADLEAFAQEHKGMSNIPHTAGHFLHILVRALGARRVLEIGTSNGYSGIWLATALQRTAGKLITVERDSAKVKLARRNFRQAGLSDVVDLRMGDAARVLRKLTGSFDLVFFDAGKEQQLDYLQLLLDRRQLRTGGLIVSDNALTHPAELAAYHSFVRTHPRLESLTVPIGNGLEVSRMRR
ncbi:MAG: O-methyltransferase [Anaerolineae bacterium]